MSDEVVSGWRVATYTGGQGNCVEVGRSAAAVAVRDTKDRKGARCCASILPSGRRSRSSSKDRPVRRTGPRSEDRNPRAGVFVRADWPDDKSGRVCAGTPEISPGTLIHRCPPEPLERCPLACHRGDLQEEGSNGRNRRRFDRGTSQASSSGVRISSASRYWATSRGNVRLTENTRPIWAMTVDAHVGPALGSAWKPLRARPAPATGCRQHRAGDAAHLPVLGAPVHPHVPGFLQGNR